MEYLFTKLNSIDTKYVVKVACMEIYQEQVYDLLVQDVIQRQPLQLRESRKDGFFLEGCKLVSCIKFRAACKVIDIALRGRSTGSHDINVRSSRSHFITDLFVEMTKGSATSMGRVTLVDLAGSERLKDTKSKGKALAETGFINKSLYVLGKVIAGLVRSAGNSNHRDVPFRDSKLTKLMINSLGGSGKTLLIACVSECSVHLTETMRTLKFSTSCARIKNRPVRQFDPQTKLILELKNEIPPG